MGVISSKDIAYTATDLIPYFLRVSDTILLNFSNPLYSISSETEKSHALEEELEKRLHEVGSITYPAIAYDSYWIAALSLDKNSTINSDNENLTKSFKELVVGTVESFEGMSGQIKLNTAGDRIGGNYDFWIVVKDNDTQSFVWKKEHNLLTDSKEVEKPYSFK